MKVRDSGMPDEEMWAGFFNPEEILRSFGIDRVRDVAEFGCGYGTFTFPAERLASGTVFAFDIEQGLIDAINRKRVDEDNVHIRAMQRDFVAEGTGLPDGSVDAALLFNILHHEHPVALFNEAKRVVRSGGVVAVIHWNHDPATPRGPSLDIRPKPERCIEWGRSAGLTFDEKDRFNFPPYHYGLLFRRP